MGTRGVPAKYGGFETAVEEVGRRLAERGHDVTVYSRRLDDSVGDRYLGMRLVNLPAARHKALDTLSHTAASVAHLVTHRKQDVVVLFNAANSPFLPALRARGVPVATHVDGLEWQRAKWGRVGRHYYRVAESLGVRWSDALIADAQGIEDYYRTEFDVAADHISYGAPILAGLPAGRLPELGLAPGQFHLVVARFEPENHVHLAVEGFTRSRARHPLIVVGSAPYSDKYTQRITAAAEADPRIRLLGPVWDQEQLDQLYAHALTYIHGHSVGGTNPSLLRAMGAGTGVIAYDVVFNREVLGNAGRFFSQSRSLAPLLEDAEADVAHTTALGVLNQQRAEREYRWDDVADRYEALCRRLAAGSSQRGTASGRRRSPTRRESSGVQRLVRLAGRVRQAHASLEGGPHESARREREGGDGGRVSQRYEERPGQSQGEDRVSYPEQEHHPLSAPDGCETRVGDCGRRRDVEDGPAHNGNCIDLRCGSGDDHPQPREAQGREQSEEDACAN